MSKILRIGHVALRCKDLETTVSFYRDVLGCPVKFRLTFREWLNFRKIQAAEKGETLTEEYVDGLAKRGDETWIAYMDLGGQFIELFDAEGATIEAIPDGRFFNYQHVSLELDDIHDFTEKIREKGAPIDSEPSLGLEHTWQMWSHDPDGNKIEFMQYTDRSYQVVGKEKSEY